jgi:hypothetical protein
MKKQKKKREKTQESPIHVPKLSTSKLKDIAWSLDIKESIYSDKEQK